MPLDATVGGASANTYTTLAEADAYFLMRGNVEWAAALGPDREAALVRATFAMDAKWNGKWAGTKAAGTQRLAWPRVADREPLTLLKDGDGFDIAADALPQALKDTCAEIALIELGARFLPVVQASSRVKRKKTDVLETEFFDDAPAVPEYPYIDQMLVGLVTSTGGAVTVGVTLGLTAEEQAQGYADPFDNPAYFIRG